MCCKNPGGICFFHIVARTFPISCSILSEDNYYNISYPITSIPSCPIRSDSIPPHPILSDLIKSYPSYPTRSDPTPSHPVRSDPSLFAIAIHLSDHRWIVVKIFQTVKNKLFIKFQNFNFTLPVNFL